MELGQPPSEAEGEAELQCSGALQSERRFHTKPSNLFLICSLEGIVATKVWLVIRALLEVTERIQPPSNLMSQTWSAWTSPHPTGGIVWSLNMAARFILICARLELPSPSINREVPSQATGQPTFDPEVQL